MSVSLKLLFVLYKKLKGFHYSAGLVSLFYKIEDLESVFGCILYLVALEGCFVCPGAPAPTVVDARVL